MNCHTYFNMDKVKLYLDRVLSQEEYYKTFSRCADDIYRVNSHKPRLGIKDVEIWLRGLKIGVDYIRSDTEKRAKEFAKDIAGLTKGPRSVDDVYWWALATGVWVYGGMDSTNPLYKNN